MGICILYFMTSNHSVVWMTWGSVGRPRLTKISCLCLRNAGIKGICCHTLLLLYGLATKH